MENEPRNLTIGTLIRVAHVLDGSKSNWCGGKGRRRDGGEKVKTHSLPTGSGQAPPKAAPPCRGTWRNGGRGWVAGRNCVDKDKVRGYSRRTLAGPADPSPIFPDTHHSTRPIPP